MAGPVRADVWLVDGQTSSGRTAFLSSGRIALCAARIIKLQCALFALALRSPLAFLEFPRAKSGERGYLQVIGSSGTPYGALGPIVGSGGYTCRVNYRK
jgi:hypothetical protein